MSKAVLISIRPKWCELIASGHKTIEIRKTRPQIKTPFKCYIYQTLPKSGDWNDRDGHVIGEFVCDEIMTDSHGEHDVYFEHHACVTVEEQREYAPDGTIYGWHISELKVYDKPKTLQEFNLTWETIEKRNKGKMWVPMEDMEGRIKRPPQSWMYVEEKNRR